MMWSFASSDIFIEPVRAFDAPALADIHRAAFARAWSAEEISRLLDTDGVVGFMCRRPATWFRPESKDPKGFVLARIAADEAEILTIAVAPDARELGVGKALMRAVMHGLYGERIKALFLEVDEQNEAAIALYKGLQFKTVGERKSYYSARAKAGAGAAADSAERPRALVMRCDLR